MPTKTLVGAVEPEPPSRPGPESFRSIVEEALDAFGDDVSYAVAMSRAAAAIERKREVWSVRLELRAAERDAREQCSQVVPFKCKTKSPCGTGDCRFALGDFALINVPDCPGTKYRPQMDSMGRYSVEPALGPLRELRESHGEAV